MRLVPISVWNGHLAQLTGTSAHIIARFPTHFASGIQGDSAHSSHTIWFDVCLPPTPAWNCSSISRRCRRRIQTFRYERGVDYNGELQFFAVLWSCHWGSSVRSVAWTLPFVSRGIQSVNLCWKKTKKTPRKMFRCWCPRHSLRSALNCQD